MVLMFPNSPRTRGGRSDSGGRTNLQIKQLEEEYYYGSADQHELTVDAESESKEDTGSQDEEWKALASVRTHCYRGFWKTLDATRGPR